MSGLEVVGLILRGLPLLISAGEHYREGFEPLKRWKRFHKDFVGFIDRLDIERQLYRQMMLRLLLSAGIPDYNLHIYMNSSFEGWNTTSGQKPLERILGPTLPAFLGIVRLMNVKLERLHPLLSLKEGKVFTHSLSRVQES
jgi:hypothetical protein